MRIEKLGIGEDGKHEARIKNKDEYKKRKIRPFVTKGFRFTYLSCARLHTQRSMQS